MSSSGTSTSRIHSPSVAAIWSNSVPISTGRPIRFLRASQVVMMPSCGERTFIDSICSSTISIRALVLLAVILGLGPLCLDLQQFLRILARPQLLGLEAERGELAFGFLAVGDQAVELLLKVLAVELDDDVAGVHPLVVVEGHRRDDAGDGGVDLVPCLRAGASRGLRS